nr:DNA polymerase III subunit beta [Maliibacterium massiliense]
MKFSCQRNDLQAAIAVVTRALATKSTISVLEGICIKGKGDYIELTCTDLEMGIQTTIPASIQNDAAVVVPGRLFAEVVRKLPDGEVDIEVADDYTLTMKCMGSRTTLQALSDQEYPALPALLDEHAIEVPERDFRDMVRQALFAVAQDDARPILTGALIEVDGHSAGCVTLDGYRLALRTLHLEKPAMERSFVVPGKSLGEIARILGDGAEAIALHVQDNHFMVEMGDTRIITRLMDGEFIKYRQILPKEYATRVHVQVQALGQAIERASLMAREGKNNLIKINISQDKMVITSNSEVGQAYEEVPVYTEGKELEIAFNARYISDVLKALDVEEVYMELNTNISPCVFRPAEGDSFIYLVLPVRLYGA